MSTSLLLLALASSDDHELRENAPTLQAISIGGGAVYAAEGPGTGITFGPSAPHPPQPFVTKGGFAMIEAQFGIAKEFSIATRARTGSLSRAPVTRPAEELRDPNADLTGLDPQLGDRSFGGSFALIARFLPEHVAIDLGVTRAFGSFRPRWVGDLYEYPRRCGDCSMGQNGFTAWSWVPTARVSSTGRGGFWSVGTGEGYIRSYEPTLLELLIGHRSESFDAMIGISHGIGLRVDVPVGAGLWLSLDANVTRSEVPQHRNAFFVSTLSIAHRTSSFAPP